MLSPRGFQRVRSLSGLVLLGASARHAILAVRGDGDVARHWLFVAVNAGMAALLVLRPRWAFYPLLALGAQQMYSHGLDLSRSFLGTAPLDTWSLAVCLFFPTIVTILFLERQEEKEARERAANEGDTSSAPR